MNANTDRPAILDALNANGYTEAAQAADLAATVDALADTKAKIAALQAREDELKAVIAAAGLDVIEGSTHRAAVSITARTAIDWKAIAEHLKPSRQLITAHTTTGTPHAVVRISAKKTS